MFNIIDINLTEKYSLSMKNIVLLGKAIKEKRLSLNLTMDFVARKANITRATLWSIESGKGNYSINSLINVMNVLSMKLSIDEKDINVERNRASRTNTALDKKINRFVIMCIEQYCSSIKKKSSEIYPQLIKKGIIDDLTNDYEDLHGMSTVYINDYIDSVLANG